VFLLETYKKVHGEFLKKAIFILTIIQLKMKVLK